MTKVIYVHGMWMPAFEMAFIQNHIAEHHDMSGQLFGYPSVRGTLDENAELLADFIRDVAAGERVHLVGHSLGGVLLMRMLALNPEARIARAVCIGSPLCGSRAAMAVSQHEWGRAILGKSIADGVAGSLASDWASEVTSRHEVGIIAGTTSAGLGRLVTTFDGPNDGTVAVAETKIPGAKDHLSIEASHSGLVLSRAVAEQVAAFLKLGKFFRK